MTGGSRADAVVFADFMDGETALVHRVQVSFDRARGGLNILLPGAGEAIFWPLAAVRSLPDQADRASVVLARAGNMPARLVIRNRAFASQLNALCSDLRRPDKTPHLWRRLLVLAAGSIASVSLIVFVLVPMLANQLADYLPRSGERALGDATFKQIRLALGKNNGLGIRICDNPSGRVALNKMMARLSAKARLPYQVRLHVLDHGLVNAFALPGGHIVLFRGLLKNAKSPEEVAGVLGHEMGHIARRDPTRLALRSAGSIGVLGLLLGDFAGGAAILYLSEKLIDANYSRKAEAAADTYAQTLLGDAGLPTGPMADFFLRLLADNGRGGGLMSHLARHPDLKGRAKAARLANRVGNNFRPILTRSEWLALKGICG